MNGALIFLILVAVALLALFLSVPLWPRPCNNTAAAATATASVNGHASRRLDTEPWYSTPAPSGHAAKARPAAILGPDDPDDTTGCEFSAWSAWQGTCDFSGGNCEGFQFKTRSITKQSRSSPCGPGETVMVRPCADAPDAPAECAAEEQDCVLSSTWSDWQGCENIGCFNRCGELPQEYRFKTIVTPGGRLGKPCNLMDMFQFRACTGENGEALLPCPISSSSGPVNCVPEDWSVTDWEGCPLLCTPAGQPHPKEYRRRRVRTPAANGGRDCTLEDLVESRDCALDTCRECSYSSWSEWQRCSVPCGDGVTFRVRDVAQEANDGTTCDDTVEWSSCSLGTCPVSSSVPDCVAPNWDYIIAQCAYICDKGGDVAPESSVMLYDVASSTEKPACPLDDAVLDLVCPRANVSQPVSASNKRTCPSGIDCVYEDWVDRPWGVCSRNCSAVNAAGGYGLRARHRSILSHGLSVTPCDFAETEWLSSCNAEHDYTTAPLWSCLNAPVFLPESSPSDQEFLRIMPGTSAWPAAANAATGQAAIQAICDDMDACAGFEMDTASDKAAAFYTRTLDYLIEQGFCSGSSTAAMVDGPCTKNGTCSYSSWELVQQCPACAPPGSAAPRAYYARDITRSAKTGGLCTGILSESSACAGLPDCDTLARDCQYGEWPSTQGPKACENLPAPRIFPNSWQPYTRQAWAQLGNLPAGGLAAALMTLSGSNTAGFSSSMSALELQQILATALNSQALAGSQGLPIHATFPNNVADESFAFAWNASTGGWDVIGATESLTDARCNWTDESGFVNAAAQIIDQTCDDDRRNLPAGAGFQGHVRNALYNRCECPSLCDAEHPDTCAWSQCHGACGEGTRYVSRGIVAGPLNGGEPCSIAEQFLESSCDTGHPCDPRDNCPYGVNGKICSGHGTCTADAAGNDVCVCEAPWVGAYCGATCPFSEWTGQPCNLGFTAADIAALNEQRGMAVSSGAAMEYAGWTLAGQQNTCNASGACTCSLMNPGARAVYGGVACDMACPRGFTGALCASAVGETLQGMLPEGVVHFAASEFAVAGAKDDTLTLNLQFYVNGTADFYAGPYDVRGMRLQRQTMTLGNSNDAVVASQFMVNARNCGLNHAGDFRGCFYGGAMATVFGTFFPPYPTMKSVTPLHIPMSGMSWLPLKEATLEVFANTTSYNVTSVTWEKATDGGEAYVGYVLVYYSEANNATAMPPALLPSDLPEDVKLSTVAVLWFRDGATVQNGSLDGRLAIATMGSTLTHVNGQVLMTSTGLAPAKLGHVEHSYDETAHFPMVEVPIAPAAPACWKHHSNGDAEHRGWSDAIQCAIGGAVTG
jgi:hypothetical protein